MNRIFLGFLFCLSIAFQPQGDQVIPPGNEGPPYFYPANPADRLYKLPWAAGDTFEIDDHWGYPTDPNHILGNGHTDYAIDISFPPMYPIRAVRGGKVLSVLKGDSVCNPAGLGNFIKIFHPDSLPDSTRASGWRNILCMDYYYHIHYNVPVKLGDVIKQGQIIAYTWCSAMPVGGEHLHFEVQIQGHKGSFDFDADSNYTFESVPVAFLEIRQNSNGLPDEGFPYISQNANVDQVETRKGTGTPLPVRWSAYPNPFKTRIEFSIAHSPDNRVSLEIFDLAGKRLEPVTLEKLPAKGGLSRAIWNPAAHPSGIYITKLHLPGRMLTKQILLVR